MEPGKRAAEQGKGLGLTHGIGIALAALALAGAAYMLLAALLVGGYRTRERPTLTRAPGVTLLKPLHGHEPRLDDNLNAAIAQEYPGPVQTIFGVSRAGDPALAAVARLRHANPRHDIAVVVDGTRHGSNAKVSNLANMAAHARHEVIVLADSDMGVPPSHLARVVAELERPGVGAVTCLYYGRGDAGFWSRFAAAGISWQFLPGVVVGRALGLAKPCMGATIALRAETLDAVGGFGALADTLADDHALGVAVAAKGWRLAAPPMLLAHGSAERSAGEMMQREVRANATVREIEPIGFAGSLLTYPLPLALGALAALGTTPVALATVAAATVARFAVAIAADHAAGARTAPLAWLPARDIVSFGLFVASFFARSVDWRGARLTLIGHGAIATAVPEPAQ